MQPSPQGSLPSIYRYLDYRVFLKDWFDARKRLEPEYSYTLFARAGGCSKAALANVVGGARTPREATLDAFARAMDLKPAERAYLGLLVELASSRGVARRAVMERILVSERYRGSPLSDDLSAGVASIELRHWYTPVIRELMALRGFRRDPAWIASMLEPTILPEEAEQALRTLIRLGFLVEKPDGTLARGADFDGHHHHPPPGTSHDPVVLSTTVALDPTKLEAMQYSLKDVVDLVASLGHATAPVSKPTADNRIVYRVQIQLLPSTRRLD